MFQFLLCCTFAHFRKLSYFAEFFLTLGIRNILHSFSQHSKIFASLKLNDILQQISQGMSGSWFKCLLFKAVFLSSFPAVYSELLKLFDVREVANLVQDTLGSLPTIVHVDDSLQAVKLQCIGKTVESQLYTNPGRGCESPGWSRVSRKPLLTCGSQSSTEAIETRKLKITFSKILCIRMVE